MQANIRPSSRSRAPGAHPFCGLFSLAVYLGQAVPEVSAGDTFPGRPYVLTFQQLAIAFE